MRILAADDEKIALDGMVKAIREADPQAEIYSFQNPAEALTFFRYTICDVVFLDIQMRGMNGIDLAREMQKIHPHLNIIFATGYDDYMREAFDMYVSGYILKPITPKKIKKELEHLRFPMITDPPKRVRIHTFGNFEIYADNRPVTFKYTKTKEMVAYLVDRKGTYCKNSEIMAALWQDTRHASYLSNMKKDLTDTLQDLKCSDIIEMTKGSLRICMEKVACDYFDWCCGQEQVLNQYRGEYMTQYSWAEFTNGVLHRVKGLQDE